MLEHWHYDTFRATFDQEWRRTGLMTFTLDGDGQPSALEAFGARFTRAMEGK